MPPLQQVYFDELIARVQSDRYPSHQILDRLEASIWTPEQVADYVSALLQKLQESYYPSHQILERIERMMRLTATVAR